MTKSSIELSLDSRSMSYSSKKNVTYLYAVSQELMLLSARFVNKVAVTNEGEKAKIHYYLDTDKIAEEEMYDGLYAVCTDLLDDDVADILKVSEGRWQIEDCFRTMKTDFEASPVYLNREDRIKSLSERNLYYRTITSYFKGYKICRCRRTGIHAGI